MTLLFLVAILAGAASVLSPCVLPLLPSILAVSSASGGRRRVVGIILGIELSFIIISLLLSSAISALGLPDTFLQYAAAVILVAFGLVLLVPKLDEVFQRVTSRAVSMLPRRGAPSKREPGFATGFTGGLGLGLVWTPCAGPFLGAAVTLGQGHSGDHTAQSIAITAGFALGMVVPLAIIVVGGRRAGAALRAKLGGGTRILAPMGLVLVITGVAVGTGALTKLDDKLKDLGITSTPTAGIEKRALRSVRHSTRSAADTGNRPSAAYLSTNGYPASSEEAPGKLVDYGPAPDFAGVSHWFNTKDGKPLTIADLKGKVVLVDFWTYSCINCLRTLPHIRELDRKYRSKGLVVVGVHTPEFQFEKDPGNVGKAITDLGVDYPVALDPDYGTWNRYHNQYWPAHYLIDRDGNIRATHYGEGGYDETENLVRKLLRLAPTADAGGMASGGEHFADGQSDHPVTPETWFGAGKINGTQFSSTVDGKALQNGDPLPVNRVATYGIIGGGSTTRADRGIPAGGWAFTGPWKMEQQRSTAGAGARMLLHYGARDVYVVAGPGASKSGRLTIRDGSGAATVMPVDGVRLYTLRAGTAWNDGLLTVDVSPGVELYSLTFG